MSSAHILRQVFVNVPRPWKLKRQYDMSAADFLIIYTKEAHPVGGWEVDRNKDDNIRISNAGDMNARTIACGGCQAGAEDHDPDRAGQHG